MTEGITKFTHCPVLVETVIDIFSVFNGGNFLDCTFGGGGHSKALLMANNKNFVYAIDCDPDAKKRAQEFADKQKNFRFYQINFSEIDCLQLPPLHGIIVDLGVSSFQLDDEIRGFSFKHHSVLDMRMDNSRGQTAEEFLRTASKKDLEIAIRDYGEEDHWKKIINVILDNRKNDSIRYTDTFAKLIAQCFSPQKGQRIHPATKTFQGIRIFINRELYSLEYALPILFEKLVIGGRLAVISFHSLEDRMVKRFFKKIAGIAVDKFDNQPQQNKRSHGQILTKKPIIPNDAEINNNPRSRSAKLRVLEKTNDI